MIKESLSSLSIFIFRNRQNKYYILQYQSTRITCIWMCVISKTFYQCAKRLYFRPAKHKLKIIKSHYSFIIFEQEDVIYLINM